MGAPNHRVARLCEIGLDPHQLIDLVWFEPETLSQGLPSQRLGITDNHPIIYLGARRPAHCFTHLKGVSHQRTRDLTRLYDLQFDHDGTYFANGLEVQSCSPKSAEKPLPKELYFDQSLYSEEAVWDHYEQPLALNQHVVPQRVVNRRHKH